MSRVVDASILRQSNRESDFADALAYAFQAQRVANDAAAKSKRKPRTVYPRDVLDWFATVEEHPDRLPILADWLDEREDRGDVYAMLARAVRFAVNEGRWPERIKQTRNYSDDPAVELLRDVPTGKVIYRWTVTPKAILLDIAATSWLSEQNHRYRLTAAKKDATGVRAVRGPADAREWRPVLRYTTRPVKLVDAFRHLAILLEDA